MYTNPYGQPLSQGIWEGIKNSFRRGTALTRLVYLNIGVFLLLKLTEAILLLAGQSHPENLLLPYTGVPALPANLLYAPWTAITYMFSHFGFLHILFNMLWLYWFGTIFLNHFTGRRLAWVYILGGLSGAALYIAAYNLLPAFAADRHLSRAVGASASVMAVVFAVCAHLPRHRVHVFLIGPVRLSTLALFTVIIDILSIPGGNAGGHIAHLGGAIFGVLSTLTRPRLRPRRSPRTPRMEVKYRHPRSDDRGRPQKRRSDRINAILDKISKSGYASLTKEEKQTLFKERE